MANKASGSGSDDFSALGLDTRLVETLTGLGYEEPTPIQRESIPPLLTGRDLIGQAATGTGKTAAFALPMIQRIAESGAGRKKPSAMILVPMRERGVDIVVATPGRAVDHITRKTLDLSSIRILVLDEADEMLDMGFAEDL